MRSLAMRPTCEKGKGDTTDSHGTPTKDPCNGSDGDGGSGGGGNGRGTKHVEADSGKGSRNGDGGGATTASESFAEPMRPRQDYEDLLDPMRGDAAGHEEFFDSPLPDKYRCPICLSGLRDAVQTQCGHRFCRGCLAKWANDQGVCPVDRVPVKMRTTHVDLAVQREVLELKVQCRLQAGGCRWVGRLRDLKDHASSECKTTCAQCGKKKVLVGRLAHHLQKECSEATISCPFEAETGCKTVGARRVVEEHVRRELVNHLSDAFAAIRAAAAASATSAVSAATSATAAAAEASLAVAAVSERSGGPRECGDHDARTRIEHNEREVRLLREEIVRLREVALSAKSSVDEVVAHQSCDAQGRFVWKIKYVNTNRQAAMCMMRLCLYSPSFYTRQYGYCMCLRLALNGCDAGTGKHVAFFVHIVGGEYDDLLAWPFTGRLTLQILDQSDAEQRMHITEPLIAKPTSPAFQRPAKQTRNHKGYGYLEFAPIEQLFRRESPYVKNDTLYASIIVHPT